MICKLKLKILDLHACPGDGVIKKYEVTKDLFSEADVEATEADIDGDLAQKSERASVREKKRTKYEPLVAFKDSGLYKMGGPYGKFAGLMKTASKILWSQKTPGFSKGYKSFVRSLVIKPVLAELHYDKKDIVVQSIPQITAGRSKALIVQYYEMLPESTCDLEIIAPEGSKQKLMKLLKTCQGLPFGPKSRGQVEIVNTVFTAA